MFININKDDKAALMQLKGIGPIKADKIIKHRTENKFRSTKELMLIEGISLKTYREIRSALVIAELPKRTSKFFKNLCRETQHDNGISFVDRNSRGWIFMIANGKYSGTWTFKHNATHYSPLETYSCINTAAAVRLGFKSWKKALVGTVRGGPQQKDLFNIREFMLKVSEESKISEAEGEIAKRLELAIWGLLGRPGLKKFRSLNKHLQLAIGQWVGSKFFLQAGSQRRGLILGRMIDLGVKSAFRKSYKFHPAITNQIVRELHDDSCRFRHSGHISNKLLLRLNSRCSVDAARNIIKEAEYFDGRLPDLAKAELEAKLIAWYAKYPGQFTLLENLLRELKRFIRLGDFCQDMGIESVAKILSGVESFSPRQVRKIHDKEIPKMRAEKNEAIKKFQNEAALRRASYKALEDEKLQERLKKYPSVASAWEKLKAMASDKEVWESSLGLMEVPGLVLLRNRSDYIEEGRLMHHCVSSYYQSSYLVGKLSDTGLCSYGLYHPLQHSDPTPEAIQAASEVLDGNLIQEWAFTHVYHVEVDGEKATFAVTVNCNEDTKLSDMEVVQDQLMGPCNKAPSKKVVEYVKSCLAKKGWMIEVKAGYNRNVQNPAIGY